MLSYAEADPSNLSLLSDAAAAAYEERDYRAAAALLAGYEKLSPLPAKLENLKGLVALVEGRFDDAAASFESVHRQDDKDPAARLNLAWARSGQRAYDEALTLLDDETLKASADAPALKLHVMHHLGLYEEGLSWGAAVAERIPANEALMGALATLALDAEKPELALAYARRAGHNAEGRAALGILTLGDHHVQQAREMFDEAITSAPQNPRAWVGKGLALLVSGDAAAAAAAIERGAGLFQSHIGSWIAAGWAYFVSGDNDGARKCFEQAVAIDANFSECHGGLAVLDIAAGRLDEARRETEVALRLDRNCFGGALAKVLLLELGGHPAAAQKIRDIALSTPIGPNGRTIAQELVAFGGGGRPRPRNGEGPQRRG